MARKKINKGLFWLILVMSVIFSSKVYGTSCNITNKTVIVISSQASTSDPIYFAAAELEKYLEAISGKTIAIIRDNELNDSEGFVIGENALSLKAGTIAGNELGNEGYLLKTIGNRLYIIGSARGSIYGIYSLLEEYYGCGFFATECEKVPVNSNSIIPAVSKKHIPPFSYRDLMNLNFKNDPDLAVKNKLNGKFMVIPSHKGGIENWVNNNGGGIETFYEIIPPSVYFSNHPEYFSEIEGKRIQSQLCLTNPNVKTIIRDWIFNKLSNDSTIQGFNIVPQDGSTPCQCSACSAFKANHGGTEIEMFIEVLNQIASELATYPKYKDVKLMTLAYSFHIFPPVNDDLTIKPDAVIPLPNVQIQFAPLLNSKGAYCISHSYFDRSCDINGADAALLEKWRLLCPTGNLAIWDYNADWHHYLMPIPVLRIEQTNIKYYASHGVSYVMYQGPYNSNHITFSELTGYITAKLLWDPNCNVDSLGNEFINNYYGVAAPKIREYLDLLYKVWTLNSTVHQTVYQKPTKDIYTPEFMAKAQGLFTSALSLAGSNEPYRKRVLMEQLQLGYINAYMLNDSSSNHEAVVNQLASDISKVGVSRIGEPYSTAQHIENFLSNRTAKITFFNYHLNGVKWEGVPNFNENWLAYYIPLPASASKITMTDARARNPKSSIKKINPAVTVPGVSAIEVTAADGITKATYTATFYKEVTSPSYFSISSTSAGIRLNCANYESSKMFDRNYTTTWLSGKKQTKGDYIVINLGSSHNFRGIYINPFNAGDYFSGYEISTSADGVNFGSPVTSGATTSQKPEIYYQSKRPITASYIKITLTVTSDKWWSIANFDITGPVK